MASAAEGVERCPLCREVIEGLADRPVDDDARVALWCGTRAAHVVMSVHEYREASRNRRARRHGRSR